jgi:hypothetical protein
MYIHGSPCNFAASPRYNKLGGALGPALSAKLSALPNLILVGNAFRAPAPKDRSSRAPGGAAVAAAGPAYIPANIVKDWKGGYLALWAAETGGACGVAGLPAFLRVNGKRIALCEGAGPPPWAFCHGIRSACTCATPRPRPCPCPWPPLAACPVKSPKSWDPAVFVPNREQRFVDVAHSICTVARCTGCARGATRLGTVMAASHQPRPTPLQPLRSAVARLAPTCVQSLEILHSHLQPQLRYSNAPCNPCCATCPS